MSTIDWLVVRNHSQEEIEAAAYVSLMLAAATEIVARTGETVHLHDHELHNLFPIFANHLGLVGVLYENVDGRCPAVIIHGEGGPEKFFIFISGPPKYISKDVESHPDSKRIREGALEFCKTLRPDWPWPA